MERKEFMEFWLNDTQISVKCDEIDLGQSLIEFIRDHGSTGTKLGCSEGGCGSCTCVVASWDHVNRCVVYASTKCRIG